MYQAKFTRFERAHLWSVFLGCLAAVLLVFGTSACGGEEAGSVPIEDSDSKESSSSTSQRKKTAKTSSRDDDSRASSADKDDSSDRDDSEASDKDSEASDKDSEASDKDSEASDKDSDKQDSTDTSQGDASDGKKPDQTDQSTPPKQEPLPGTMCGLAYEYPAASPDDYSYYPDSYVIVKCNGKSPLKGCPAGYTKKKLRPALADDDDQHGGTQIACVKD